MMCVLKQPIAYAFLDGPNTGSMLRRSMRINRTAVTILLVLVSLSSDQIVAAANLRSRASESSTDGSKTQQQKARSLEEPNFICPPHHLGYYPTTECKSYYWCSDGSPARSMLYSCGDGLLFDVEKGRCDWEKNVDCPILIPEFTSEKEQWVSPKENYEAMDSNGQPSEMVRVDDAGDNVSEKSIIKGTSPAKQQTAATTTSYAKVYNSLVEILHPTPQPTSPPTKYPTTEPTTQPTKQPTSEPTPSPPPTSLSPTVSSQPTSEKGVAVQPLADTTISQSNPNINYGSHPMLLVDGGMTGAQQKYDTLVKFDLSFLESGMSFGKVFLRMFVKDASSNFCGQVETTQNAYWNEDSITWMNAPITTSGVKIGEARNTVSGDWFELDVTGALKWVLLHDKQKLFSIRISSNEPKRCIFSSTSDDGHAPHLFARYSKQQETPAAIGSTSHPDVLGSTSHPTLPSPSAPVSTSRQHGEALLLFASEDATITKEEPSLVSGKEATLVVKEDDFSTQDILLQFDITSLLKTIPRTAVLMLHAPNNCNFAGTFVSSDGNGWTEDTVSWSTAPTFQYNGLWTEIGTFSEVLEGDKYATFDVMRALSWNTVNHQDILTFRISSNKGHHCEYTSKEGGQPPKLLLQF